jgi:predicted phage terminase large subunit-like protein
MPAQAALPKLTEQDWLNIERELCARSLAEFAKQAWHILEPGTPLKWGWALDAICAHLEAVSKGEIKRLLMNVPPGSMKSLLTSVIWPAWEWGPRAMPHLRYLGTAHKQDLAVRDNLKCRRLIQSDWYQTRWPTELTGDQNAKTKFENSSTGFREAMSFTSLTGSRGDRVIIDDPHSVDDANSAVMLAGDIRTFREALPSRVNNDESAIVIIMQRLNEKDVSAVALELGYKHLCIPMRYEGKKEISTCLPVYDPRTKDGELMFPERFPEEQVVALELSLGTYATAGQLQQRPAPLGGGIFRDEWWKFYTPSAMPKIKYRTIYADTAQKTKEQNDYSVFQCWGHGEDGRIYLLDMIRGKWEAPQLLTMAEAFWNKHKAEPRTLGSLRKLKIEDKSSGTGLIQQLKQKGIPVEGIPRATDKVTRAYDTAPQIEIGNVRLPEGAPFVVDILSEAATFPNAAHDDTLDPLMDAVYDMLVSADRPFDYSKLV